MLTTLLILSILLLVSLAKSPRDFDENLDVNLFGLILALMCILTYIVK